jgi:pimeloyl-ACP methyl ester carboxylesterase
MVFMSWNSPSAEYRKILERRHIIWVGFDCYKIDYVPLSNDHQHELFALAMAYNLQRYFNIDPSRVYIAGMSWGGRLSGRIASRNPNVFRGAISTDGCQVENWDDTQQSFLDGLWFAQENTPMVITSGDFDFNRGEAFYMSAYLHDRNYRNIMYIQEAGKYHDALSPVTFDRALGFLDRGKNAPE